MEFVPTDKGLLPGEELDLQKKIPDFDWTGGHSGRALTQEQVHKLIDLWNEYIEKNPEIEEWNDNGRSRLMFA